MRFRHYEIWQPQTPCLQLSLHAVQNAASDNTVEAWQWGYGLVCFLVWYSFLHLVRLASTKHGWSGDEGWFSYSAANSASRLGTWTRIVEPFKHHLCESAHPQFCRLPRTICSAYMPYMQKCWCDGVLICSLRVTIVKPHWKIVDNVIKMLVSVHMVLSYYMYSCYKKWIMF